MSESVATIFYTAFQNKDAQKMQSLYHDKAVFQDPAFGKLNALEAGNMWLMLMERSKGKLDVTFKIIEETDEAATCLWEAKYLFGPKKRPIHNKITAHLKFKDGLIIEHIDNFNFWKWAGMALGPTGWLMGFTPFLKNKVRANVKDLLQKYMRENES